jgi:hypothetical protein
MNRKADLKKKIKRKLMENSDVDIQLQSVTGHRISYKPRSISNTHRGIGGPTKTDFPSIISHRPSQTGESVISARGKKVQTARIGGSNWTEHKDSGVLGQIENMKHLIAQKREMVDFLKRKSKPADELRVREFELKSKTLKLEKVKFRVEALRLREAMDDSISQNQQDSGSKEEKFH